MNTSHRQSRILEVYVGVTVDRVSSTAGINHLPLLTTGNNQILKGLRRAIAWV